MASYLSCSPCHIKKSPQESNNWTSHTTCFKKSGLFLEYFVPICKRYMGYVVYEFDKKITFLLIDCYNDYVKLVGKVGQKGYSTIKQSNQIYTIEDSLPLIHFLSESEVKIDYTLINC